MQGVEQADAASHSADCFVSKSLRKTPHTGLLRLSAHIEDGYTDVDNQARSGAVAGRGAMEKTLNKTFVHKLADVSSAAIGEGTRIWQYVVILAGARIGADCNICSHVLIENDVIIGNRVTVKSGVQLWDGLRVGDDVFIGPNATFTNDKFPRSKQYPAKCLETTIENGASIGAGAVILPGITIGSKSMIAAGSVVTRNVDSRSLVQGNPARHIRFLEQ